MELHNNFMGAVDRNSLLLPSRGRIRSGYISGITGLMSRMGANPREMLEYQDIDPLLLDDPDSDLECMDVVNLLEYCSSALDDPIFGAHLAEQQDPDAYGCVIALVRAAPTFGEALQCLMDYTPLSTSPECEIEILQARQVVELRWRTHIGLGNSGQTSYHGVLLMMKILQMLGREQFRPRYANLSSPVSRSQMRSLQAKLGCRVQGNAQSNGIAFSVDLLDRPVSTANRTLYTLLKNNLTQLQAMGTANFVEQVEACVRQLLNEGHCSVELCADKLGTSSRTLQKRLTKLDCKFSTIVQQERIKLAKQTLVWSNLTLDELAFQLGYAEQTSFGRAFKRHTGMTPNAYRSRERMKRYS